MLCRRESTPCFATPQLSDAILSPCYANLRHSLADHALPSRCCPKPCRRNALLRSASAALARAFPCYRWPAHCFALARRSGAAQCRRRASHCPAFASPCPAVPPLIGAPTCLATASPCSALALLCHSTASPSLAIALLRRATPWQRSADHSRRVVPPSSAMPLQRSPEHSRRLALPQPFPASLFLSLATLVSAAALLCCAIAQRRLAIAAQGVTVPSLRCAFGSFAVAGHVASGGMFEGCANAPETAWEGRIRGAGDVGGFLADEAWIVGLGRA